MAKKKPMIYWAKPIKESSNVAATAHDSKNEKLYVRFHNGHEYEYSNVDEALYLKFINAESIGKFLNSEIVSNKGAFPAKKI